MKKFKTTLEQRKKSREYYTAHRDIQLAWQLRYNKEHREERCTKEKLRREAHPRAHAKRKRESYLRNRKQILEAAKIYNFAHRFEKAKASRKWRRLHPRWAKALRVRSKHMYRARLVKADGSFTYQEFRSLCKMFNYVCLCCGKTEKQLLKFGRKLVPDHVKPLARGGSNKIENIQPLCHGRGGCNNLKHANEIDYRHSVLREAA